MIFEQSEAIRQFFLQNRHLDGFWDFIHESGVYDAQWWSGDDCGPELIERGFDLANGANNHPVYEYNVATDDKECSGLILYFIGLEAVILNRLNLELQEWLKKYPSKRKKSKKSKRNLYNE